MIYLDEPLVLYRQHAGNVTGVIGGKGKKSLDINRAERKRLDKEKIRLRVNAFYNACPETCEEEKKVLNGLVNSW
jgi:hypothetical protein